VNNEEKILKLLESMQIDMKDLKHGQSETNKRLDRVETRLDNMETRLDNMETRLDSMESGIKELKIDVKELKETTSRIDVNVKYMKETEVNLKADIIELKEHTEKCFIEVNKKIDSMQIDVNNLTSKTAQNDNKIIELKNHLTMIK
jgi:chromosome segregation ATPase